MELREQQIGACPNGEDLEYPGIDSCVTLTACFAGGVRTGVHLVRIGADDNANAWKNDMHTWLDEAAKQMGSHGMPVKTLILGDLECWEKEILKEIKSQIYTRLYPAMTKDEAKRRLTRSNDRGHITVKSDGSFTVR